MDTLSEKISYKYVLLSTALYVIAIISAHSDILGIITGLAQIAIFLFFLFRKNAEQSFLSLLIFTTIALEVPLFVNGTTEPVYSILMLPYLKGYHVPFLFLSIAFLIFRNFDASFWPKVQQLKNTYIIFIMFSSLFLLGLVAGLASLCFNDNNIINSTAYKVHARRELVFYAQFAVNALLITYFLTINKNFANKLCICLQYILLGIAPAALLVLIFDLQIHYGFITTFTMPLIAFLGMLLPVFIIYRQKKLYYFANTLVIFFAFLVYPSPLAAKWWLLVIFIPCFLLVQYIKSSKNIKPSTTVATLFTVFLAMTLLISNINTSQYWEQIDKSRVLSNMQKAKMALSIWAPGWYENLPISPKSRIEEFINISLEYRQKPLYIFLGKGIGGTVTDHTHSGWVDVESAFSDDQKADGLILRVHETANVLFLKNGLFGLLIFVYILYLGTKNFFSNPWLPIGLIWFLFFIQTYISMLSFGLSALFLGIYLSDIQQLEKKDACQNN